MHDYRRFVQDHLDKRIWKQADLMRASGLSRQLINSILKDDRDHLGQMPDESTLKGLATGFKVPVEVVRTAAARSLVGYADDGAALTPELQEVDIDILLNEIRRRFNELSIPQTTPSRAPGQANQGQKTEPLPNKSKQRAAVAGRRIKAVGKGVGGQDAVDR